MEQTQFSPKDSLQLIESMINKAQNRFTENGHLYLLWGWVILACSIAHFILDYWQLYDKPYLVWFATWGAFIYQMIYLAKVKRKAGVKTYTDELINYVWLVFVAMMVLVEFILAKSGNWQLTYSAFLILYGMPTFLSGAIIRFSPLRYGAFTCWLLAIASMFVDFHFHVLLLSLGVISAWIIPGYLLRLRSKNQN